MRRVVLSLSLVCLVVLSGCLGVAFGPTDSPAGSEPVTAASGSSAGTADVDGSTGSTGDASRPRTNPWGSDPVVVAVDGPATDRDYAALVADATAYWEANAPQYAGYNISYRVDPDADAPDIVVRFVEEVPACGDTNDAVGCAPLVTDSRQLDRPEAVYIQTGLSAESTTLILEHEFGHTLGLRHDDAPADVMAAESVLYTQPQPDAKDRAFPWKDAEFTVYVDDTNASDPAAARDQVGHALDYFASGADGSEGVPSNLSFRFVDDPAEADVVVQFSETSPCDDGAGSCGQMLGPDPDGDGAIETYTKLRVTLVDLDTAAVGWHVGNWLAYGLGMEAVDERPPPFQDASYSERRSDWWE